MEQGAILEAKSCFQIHDVLSSVYLIDLLSYTDMSWHVSTCHNMSQHVTTCHNMSQHVTVITCHNSTHSTSSSLETLILNQLWVVIHHPHPEKHYLDLINHHSSKTTMANSALKAASWDIDPRPTLWPSELEKSNDERWHVTSTQEKTQQSDLEFKDTCATVTEHCVNITNQGAATP